MDNFKPDKNREDAIAAIMTAKNYVVVTEQELESQHEKDGASVSYTYYYHGFMASRGLIEYGLATWKEEVYRMNNAEGE